MAITQGVAFALTIVGDGNSTSMTIVLPTSTMFLQAPVHDAAPQASLSLATVKPTGVKGVTCNGPSIASATLDGLTQILTITFDDAPQADTFNLITGYLVF